MNTNIRTYTPLSIIILLVIFQQSFAAAYTVNNKTDLQSRMASAIPGDTVIVSNGTYDFASISFTNNNGTSSSAAIVLKAETTSGVVFTGSTRLQFKGNGIEINGFKFVNGNAGANAVIRLGTSSTSVSNYCRITNVTIDNYNTPDSATENEWVGIYGIYNRVDHCTFINKSNARATIVLWYSATTYPNPAVSTYHRIDSNYFKGRSYQASNGGETIRVGDSNSSRTDGFNIIEYNLFEDLTQAEPEIISNKSDFNVYRYNTFRNSKGGLTLRHGRYCSIYGNFFLVSDNTVTAAYGIRAIDKGHKIFNNYIEAVNGNSSGGTSQLRAPINLFNGLSTDTTDANAASGYFPADSCIVAFNIIVNAKGGGGIVLGGTDGGTIQPKGILLANNLVKMATGSALYKNPSNTSLTFSSEGNIYDAPAGLGISTAGWQNVAIAFGERADGILVAPASVVQDAAINSTNYTALLSSLDAQGQTRSSIYDVGCDELNGTGAVINRPLTSADVGAGTGTTLPVTLVNFAARPSGENVVLTWVVSNEVNFKQYEIEVSNDGINFIHIGRVKADYSSPVNNYTFNHLTPTAGKNFYRLKMVNKDGSYSYSLTQTVTISKNIVLNIFPNPVSSVLNLYKSNAIGKLSEINIIDAQGKVIKRLSNVSGSDNTYNISVTGLANGMYILQLRDNNSKQYYISFIISK
jgi:poly(beta-D-mannuronate) lyase